MKPKRDTPGYRRFVEAVRQAADVVDVRVVRGEFVDRELHPSGSVRTVHYGPGEVMRMPRNQALRVEQAGIGEIVPGG